MNWLSRTAWGALRAYARIAPTERGGYRLARLARRTIPHAQWQGRFSAGPGVMLDLDLGTYPDCCMACGLYELDTCRQIRRLLRPGAWFVDCGANIGYFTLLAARWVGSAGRVDAFEPDPINRQRLESHLQANGLSGQVRVHAMAVGARAQTLTLYHPDSGQLNHGAASTYAALVPHGQAYEVPAVRLDEQLDGPPDLIKIDVEGAELAAVQGMKGLLACQRLPALIVEHNQVSAAAAGYKPSTLLGELLAMQPRYQWFWIGRSLRPIASPQAMDAFERQGNLLALPQ